MAHVVNLCMLRKDCGKFLSEAQVSYMSQEQYVCERFLPESVECRFTGEDRFFVLLKYECGKAGFQTTAGLKSH